MARVCCVEGCDSITRDEVTYFPFPVKQSLRRKWREAVTVGKLTSDSLICSQHFRAEDYETVRGKTRLKAKVVPTGRADARRETLSKSPQPSENSSETTNGKADSHDSNGSEETSTSDNKEAISNGPIDQEGGKTPTIDHESSKSPIIDRKGSKSPTIAQKGGKTPTIDQESSKSPTIDQKGSNSATIDQKGVKTPTIAQKGGKTPTIAQKGGKTPTIDQESSKSPTIDQEGGKSLTIAQKGGKTPTIDPESSKSPTIDQKGSKSATIDQKGGKTPTIDQESSKSPTIGQEGGKSPTIDHGCSNDETKTQEIDSDSEMDHSGNREDKSGSREKQDSGMDQENGSRMDTDEEYLDQEVDFGVNDRGSTGEGSVDENGHEKCTIECVPEAVLGVGSGSESEGGPHDGDIEDIIANYHIKQDRQAAERLKAAHAASLEAARRGGAGAGEAGAREAGAREAGSGNEDCLEVEFIPSERSRPVFIEIPVDRDPNSLCSGDEGDCMMVMEDVQVELDPAAVLPPSPERGGDVSSGDEPDVEEVPIEKEDPISLLTSSDEDEVIIEEPRIEVVDVSDEDEDDIPLVKLAERPDIGRILWGRAYEYYCMTCHFKTVKQGEYIKHKQAHETVGDSKRIMLVCEICNFATASKDQFSRHKKKHKEERKFKCHLCDYKAKHRMSLIYHLKSHEGVTAENLDVDASRAKKKSLTCSKCQYTTSTKLVMMKHIRSCVLKVYACGMCAYQTKRRSDLRRHADRRHREAVDAT